MELNLSRLQATNEVFKRLNVLRRWTSFVSEGKYNELSKQALNCIVAYILATYSESEGLLIKWERFPKIALYRAFQKVYVYFDTPEYIINDICYVSGIQRDAFDETTSQIIAEETDQDFANFLSEGLGTYEMQIYRAATKIATLIELAENVNSVSTHEYQTRLQEICSSLEEFENLPGVKNLRDFKRDSFKTLQTISTLRNRTRWAAHCYHIECSVLGHLFDTAIFAYFMSLEQYPQDEALAAKMFFMGIFHDVAETWTTDIPSPIKDRIKGFRKATEVYELEKLESELYSNFPDFVVDKLKEVMFEDEANQQYKKLLKGADYLSADSECWRQLKAGTRDEYFPWAINNRITKIESGEVLLTPVCHQLFDYFLEYAKSLNL